MSISNEIVSTKIYDKRDDFDFKIVNFPFLDGDVPRSTSYGVYISQLIRFARASSYVPDFNTSYKLLTQKLLKQGYRYHKLCKTFSKFYRRYYDLISKFQVGLKSLLHQGLLEPDSYGDMVYYIIASKASGRDCTNNNELLHKIGVLQRYAIHLFVFTRELYNRFDGAVSKTVVPREADNKVEGSSPSKSFFYFFFCFRKYAGNFS